MASTNSAWYTRVWRSEDGLPNDTVTSLAQTPDGYLWLATPSQLARFDGDEFEPFPQNTFGAANNQRVTIIVCSHDGSLWLPLDRGPVVRLKDGAVEVISNGVPNFVVEDAVEDGDGNLWVSYRGGTLRRIKDGKAFAISEAAGYLGARGGCSLARGVSGQFWLAQRGDIFRYENGRFRPVAHLPSTTTRITAARQGGLWGCSGPDFFRYEHDQLKIIARLPTASTATMPTTILEAQDGTVWIGTSTSGLFRYDGSGLENIPTSHRDIPSLFQDREGNLWAGTAGGGLDRIQSRTIELQGTESGLPVEAVRSVCEDAAGTLWAVTQNDALVHRVDRWWRTLSTGTEWPGGPVTCVAPDPRGGVWIGGRSRIYHWNDGKFQSWIEGVHNHIIRALWANTNGDLWIGGERLERFHDGVSTLVPMPAGVETIRAMTADAAGTIWVGSVNGHLLRVTGDEAFDETTRLLGAPDSIRCLATTSDGSLWIGFANDGLGLVTNGKMFRFGSAQGLSDDSISQIVADDLDRLWLGSDHGIFKVKRSELTAITAGTMTRVQSIRYGRDEGSPGLQASYGVSPGAIRGHDGRLWLPLRSGIAMIDPARLHDDLNPPPVLLKRVSVDDRPFATYGGVMPVGTMADLRRPRSGLALAPGHHRLEFDFTAMNFAAAENIQFRYRLDGVDDHWIDARNQRTANYPNLATGRYRFFVNARQNGGLWNPADATFDFSIRPYFWETWWFRLAAIIVFTAGAIAIGRYIAFRRLRLKLQLLEQQAALEKERSRIAKDIHDDLGGSLTQAALLLDLASQDRNDPKKVEEHLQQIGGTVRQVTESLDEIVWAANPRNDTPADLNDYISLFAVQFLQAANIRCRIDSPRHFPDRPLSPEVRHGLFLVAKEALNNVVRHAHASEVQLRIIATGESLEIHIIDDGRGFNGESGDNRYSDGLRNMEQRMADIGGRFSVESRPNAGTKISAAYFWTAQ